MSHWLQPFLMMFYSPGRAMAAVRDNSPLGVAMLLAFGTQIAYLTVSRLLYPEFSGRISFALISHSIRTVLFVAVVVIPVLALVANLLERRTSIGTALKQDYAPLASAIFYGWAAANLAAIPIAVIAAKTGFQTAMIASSLASAESWRAALNLPPEAEALWVDSRMHAESYFRFVAISLFAVWAIIAIRKVYQSSVLKTFAILLLSCVGIYFAAFLMMPLFTTLLASPILLLILYFLLRGYIQDVSRTARARASFRQNLEAATLNPADASAHYNLGLIHQSRNELDQARERFYRAVEIDTDEIDAHYQLGRIARKQNRLADAIAHFEQVVARDQTHAQNEIWREIGATYLEAGQFEDSRNALERFLLIRESDPEGLYLMGRALAALGRAREAADSMQACIQAVKTAPAYKYRTEKRWLNEAQRFLKTVPGDANAR